MKNKSILLVITILLIGLSLAGGTYAYLTMAASITNGNYNTQTTCFNIDYNISNEGSGQDISGTLFPSANASGGLSGRVGLKATASCGLNGLGTLKLHINSTTSSSLMTSASSYCQDRKTLEPISGITTEEACTTAGGRWRGYGDAYCESNSTLERLTTPTDSESCTSAGGTWKTGGSPLKYAVYDNNAGTGTPLSKGYIESTDINTDKVIYDNFVIDTNQKYYYIFIWIDGYLVDNAINNLPFSGYISASAEQTNIKYVYTANLYDENATGWNYVWQGQPISNSITQYNTPEAAITALETAYSNANSGATTSLPFFLKHTVSDGTLWCANEYDNGVANGNSFCAFPSQAACNSRISEWEYNNITYTCVENTFTGGVAESYVGFVVTSEMATNNPGMVAGTYYLKGGDNGAAFLDNAKTIYDAFGGVGCYLDGNSGGSPYTTTPSSNFRCNVSGLSAAARSSGFVNADDIAGSVCGVDNYGTSSCEVGVGGGGGN